MSETMNWYEAKAWMREHLGNELVDNTGDYFRLNDDGRFQIRDHGCVEWHDTSLDWNGYTFTVAQDELLTTIGQALDWLIAHPGEMLVDSKGVFWRIHDERLEKSPGLPVPMRSNPGLTWRPAPKQEE